MASTAEIIYNLIEEDRSVSSIVTILSSKIFDIFKKNVNINKKEPVVLNGRFRVSYGRIIITVNWQFQNQLSSNSNYRCRTHGSIDISTNNLFFSVKAINGLFDEKDAMETLQHELSHFFERLKRGKPYNDINNYKIAAKVLNTISTESNDIIVPIVANIIYLAHEFEQRAFANGAYQYLMRSQDYFNRFKKAIVKTRLFKHIEELKKELFYLEKIPATDENLVEALKPYKGLTKEKLLKICKNTINSLIYLLGRIWSKALDDYPNFHEIHSLHEPFDWKKINEDKENARIITYKKFKGLLT